MVLACGVPMARDLPIPGRELPGIHFAMEYLPLQNRRCEGDAIADDDVHHGGRQACVIIGGGDTGADCLGTVHRQGAASVHQLEVLPSPPDDARARQSVAAVAAGLPHVVCARGGRRARLRRLHDAVRRRRERTRAQARRASVVQAREAAA